MSQIVIETDIDEGCTPLVVNFQLSTSEASIVKWVLASNTESFVSSPAHVYSEAGSFDVMAQVISPEGDTLLLEHTITAFETPVPDFSIPDSACPGDVIVPEDLTTSEGTRFWDQGDGQMNTVPPSVLVDNTGEQTISLVVENESGCRGFTSKDLNSVLVSEPEVRYSTHLACGNQDTVMMELTNASDYGSVVWELNEDLRIAGNRASHAFDIFGELGPVLELSVGECIVNVEAEPSLTVIQKPNVQAQVSDSVICAQDVVSFRAIGPTHLHYVWQVGLEVITQQNFDKDFFGTGTVQVGLVVMDTSGCEFRYGDSRVTVKQNPQVQFHFDSLVGCSPFEVNFVGVVDSTLSYVWDFGDGSSSFETSPSYTYIDNGEFDVNIEVSNEAGCVQRTVFRSLVEVMGPSFELLDRAVSGCLPYAWSPEFVTNNSSNSMTWYAGDQMLSGGDSVEIVFGSAGVFDFTSVTVDNYGCKDSTVYNSVIQVFDTVANFRPSKAITLCNENAEVSFDGSLVGNDFWIWTFGDGESLSQKEVSHHYVLPGQYYVKLRTNNNKGCPTTIDSLQLVEIYGPEASFTITDLDCDAGIFDFAATAEGQSYLWDFGDSVGTSTLANPTYAFKYYRNYHVSLAVTDSNGCTATTVYLNAAPLGNCYPDAGILEEDPIMLETSRIVKLSGDTITGCNPFAVRFSVPNSDIDSLIWDFGDGQTSTEFSPSYLYKTPGEFLPEVRLYLGDSSYVVSSGLIYVPAAPVTDIHVNQSNECGGILVDLGFSGDDPSFYEWFIDDTLVGSRERSIRHNFNRSGSHVASLRSFDDLGCVHNQYVILSIGNSQASLVAPAIACVNESIQVDHDIERVSVINWLIDDTTQVSDMANLKFSVAGVHKIEAIAGAGDCPSQTTLETSILVKGPEASFDFLTPTNGCDSLRLRVKNTSVFADRFCWSLAGTVKSTTDLVCDINAIGAYDIQLIAKDDHCSDTVAIEDGIVITTANAEFDYTISSECLPATLSFSPDIIQHVSYKWDLGNGDIRYGQTLDYEYETHPTGSIKLTVIDTNGCHTSKEIGEHKLVKSRFRPNFGQGCVPFDVKLISQSRNFESVHWHSGDGRTSTLEDYSFTISDTGTFYPSLVATGASGCSDTSYFSRGLVVGELKAEFEVLGNQEGCVPLVVDYVNRSTGDSLIWWGFGDGTSSQSQTPSHIFHTPGSYEVMLVAQHNLGCLDTFWLPTNTHALGPIAAFSFLDSAQCGLSEVRPINESINADQQTWYFGNGESSILSAPGVVYETSGSYQVSLFVQDVHGCEDFEQHTINLYDFPLVHFDIDDQELCEGDTFKVENLSHSADSIAYTWTINMDTVSVDQDLVFIPDTMGSHDVGLTGKTEFGCSHTLIIDSSFVLYSDRIQKQPRDAWFDSMTDSTGVLAWKSMWEPNFDHINVWCRSTEDSAYGQLAQKFSQSDTLVKVFLDTSNYKYFKIQTVGKCTQGQPLDQLRTYSTLQVNTQAGDDGIEVSWNEYQGKKLSKLILCREDLLDSTVVVLSELAPQDTSYLDTHTVCPRLYKFFLGTIPVNNNIPSVTSTSDRAQPAENVFLKHKSHMLRTTVVDSLHILTEWEAPEYKVDLVTGYLVMRRTIDSDFDTLAFLDKDATIHVDYDAVIDGNQYIYVVKPTNSCQAATPGSRPSSNVHLSKMLLDEKSAVFQWTPYFKWKGDGEYMIQKKNRDTGIWETVDIVPEDINEYTVDLESLDE